MKVFLAFATAVVFLSFEDTGIAFQTSTELSTPTATKNAAHNHSHDDKGPNGGEILEVGKHEYHLELCVNEKDKKTTIYVLDSALKKYVPVAQPHILFNCKLAGKPLQIRLTATPLEGDPKGAASCFRSDDPKFLDALHDSKADGRISIRIGNKQYNVRVTHKH